MVERLHQKEILTIQETGVLEQRVMAPRTMPKARQQETMEGTGENLEYKDGNDYEDVGVFGLRYVVLIKKG